MAKSSRQEIESIISFINGWGFGIAEDGRTVNLGKEADVLKALANPEERSSNRSVNDIIDKERELMKDTTTPSIVPSKSESRGVSPKSKRILNKEVRKGNGKD